MEDKKFKVVFYARVSTKNESQKDSCEHQKFMCDDYILNHPQYEVVEYFIDDGISGKTDDRYEYRRMLDRLNKGDIDYIFVKDCDRLCRSVEVNGALNSLLYRTNTLVFYLIDHTIFHPDVRQERMYNQIKAIFGEDYVFMMHEKGLAYQEYKKKNGIINSNNLIYGYKWDYENDCMVIDEEEAKVIKQIFEWYVYEDLGVSEISRRLGAKGIKGKYSKNLINPRTLNQWLTNSIYKGICCFNKRTTILGVGMGAKSKRVDIPREEWVEVPCPAIISEELFDLAQTIREERNHTYNYSVDKDVSRSYFKGFHIFAGKIFCMSCGSQYQYGFSDREKKYPLYKDYFSKRTKKSLDEKCNNKDFNKIYEATLQNITRKGFSMLVENGDEIISSVISLLRTSMKENNVDDELVSLKKRLSKVEKEKQNFLDRWYTAPDEDTRDYCISKKNECVEEIEYLNNEITKLESRTSDVNEIEEKLNAIKEYLKGLVANPTIDRKFVNAFLNRIDISEDGKLYISYKFSNSKLVTTLGDFKEEKQAIRNGLPSIHRLLEKGEFFNIWSFVRKNVIQGRKAQCPRFMPIVQKMPCTDLKCL